MYRGIHPPRYRDSGILEMGLEEFILVGGLILILVYLRLDQLSQLQKLKMDGFSNMTKCLLG